MNRQKIDYTQLNKIPAWLEQGKWRVANPPKVMIEMLQPIGGPMKTLIASISLIALCSLPTVTTAAAAKYVCDIEESILAERSQGMKSKAFPEGEKLILSVSEDGRGSSVAIYPDGRRSDTHSYKVTRHDGAIRWELYSESVLRYFTLWPDTMFVVQWYQGNKTSISWMKAGRCIEL